MIPTDLWKNIFPYIVFTKENFINLLLLSHGTYNLALGYGNLTLIQEPLLIHIFKKGFLLYGKEDSS